MALGTQEMWIVAIIGGIAFLFFGAPKVLEWAKTLGKAQNEYKKARDGEEIKTA